MKLVELLARELKVWPEHGCVQITQDKDKNVYYWRRDGAVFDGDEWSHESGGLCDTKWFLDPMPASICTDHATAIVTRADWEAEVARLAKPEQSPRERIKELHALAIAVGMGVSVENPLTWRDRIREIDITVDALEEERAGLVQQLEDEGFRLIGKAVETVGDMSDWRNWVVGDHLEVIASTHGHKFEIGKIVRLTRRPGNRGECAICEYIDGRDHWALHASELKFHSRPSA